MDVIGSSSRRWWAVAAALTMAGAAGVALAVVGGDLAAALPRPLHVATGALAIVLGGSALTHWRSVGRAHGLLVAVAAALLVVASAVEVLADPAGAAVLARGALALGAATWMGRAVWGPEVDTRLAPGRELGRGLVAAAVAVAVAIAVAGRVAPAFLGAAVPAVAWAIVAVGGLRRSWDRPHGLLPWVAATATALSGAEVARLVAATVAPTAITTGAVLEVAGMLVAVVGSSLAMADAVVVGRGDAHGVHIDLRSNEERQRRAQRAMVHELRNAVMAVEGAMATLEHYGGALSEDRRTRLRDALTTGIADLRELVGLTEPSVAGRHPFRLDDVVAERVAVAQARGMDVRVVGSGQVMALGHAGATRRVLDNLLVNAERHGGGADGLPVTVVVAGGARPRVRVVDQGPGVALEDHASIFQEGWRGDGPGDGLGLAVSRRLMHGQDGELSLEPYPGSGACFAFSLPGAPVTEVDRACASRPEGSAHVAADEGEAYPPPRFARADRPGGFA